MSTGIPSVSPSALPTSIPTYLPTVPTYSPTVVPSTPTYIPSMTPSVPSVAPTVSPSSPSQIPTDTPTVVPSAPSNMPTASPSRLPSSRPMTYSPTTTPTGVCENGLNWFLGASDKDCITTCQLVGGSCSSLSLQCLNWVNTGALMLQVAGYVGYTCLSVSEGSSTYRPRTESDQICRYSASGGSTCDAWSSGTSRFCFCDGLAGNNSY